MSMSTLLLVAMAISGISFTITITSIFKGFREMVSDIHPKLEELFHCPWCLSHWVTVFFLVFIKPYSFDESIYLNYILTGFSIVCVSGVIHWVLLRTYEPVAKLMAHRKIEKAIKEG